MPVVISAKYNPFRELDKHDADSLQIGKKNVGC